MVFLGGVAKIFGGKPLRNAVTADASFGAKIVEMF